MPTNSTAPTTHQRAKAASVLRDQARALRELAAAGNQQGPLANWATERAATCELVCDWLRAPYGTCDDCGRVLEHFNHDQHGGVLCPRCDEPHVTEIQRDARGVRAEASR